MALTTAMAVTSAAKVLNSIMSAAWPLAPVAKANRVSPSMGVCTGQMLRAKPSWATCAKRWAWGLVSTASVAITPMVVSAKPTSSDPMAQRNYVSWKTWFTAVILNDLWMCRLEVAVTAL